MRCQKLWCPLCYEGLRGRRFTKGHFGYRRGKLQKEERLVVSRHKGQVREGPGGSGPPLARSDWNRRYVHVWSFIADDRYDDGGERLPGTILLCTGEGRVRLWLHNRDEGLSAWLSGETVEAVFGSAEEALGTATVEWRRPKTIHNNSSPPS